VKIVFDNGRVLSLTEDEKMAVGISLGFFSTSPKPRIFHVALGPYEKIAARLVKRMGKASRSPKVNRA
jgi:hypothetical protein